MLVCGMFGSFFFLTQFAQEILGFGPLRAGLSFVPMTGTLLRCPGSHRAWSPGSAPSR